MTAIFPSNLRAVACVLTARSSTCGGARRKFYVVDSIPERLDKAGELGALTVDFRTGDPVEQIRELRRRRLGGRLPPGEDKLGGVSCGIDAVGFQARDRSDPGQERPDQVI
jgi:glutathione-independent formaldehyde dehydrogenase